MLIHDNYENWKNCFVLTGYRYTLKCQTKTIWQKSFFITLEWFCHTILGTHFLYIVCYKLLSEEAFSKKKKTTFRSDRKSIRYSSLSEIKCRFSVSARPILFVHNSSKIKFVKNVSAHFAKRPRFETMRLVHR